jgi:hypothetical protein
MKGVLIIILSAGVNYLMRIQLNDYEKVIDIFQSLALSPRNSPALTG